MPNCLVCEHQIKPFMSFGRQPIGNGFLAPADFEKEYFYELAVGFCPRCSMVQLINLVDREKLFHENYAFHSSTSKRMMQHFREFAQDVQQKYLKNSSGPFVLEIGSNDGIMLGHFAQKGIRHLGVEPSANVAQAAIDKGIQTITEFFDEKLAKTIVKTHGQADVFLGANVMCHIPYIHSVMAGVKLALKPQGVLIFEEPYLGDIIQKTSYDQIYDEHAFYFSVTSIQNLVTRHDLEIIDVEPQNVHGGSVRYTIAHAGAFKEAKAVAQQKLKEKELGLHKPARYEQFRANVEHSRDELKKLLQNFKRQGKRVVGYGATSKSTTVTNYGGITPELVEFISDTTPIKQGKFSPGVHIPVKPYEEFAKNYPDYALLFAWNHAEEIMAKEKNFMKARGKWIVYVPRVEVK